MPTSWPTGMPENQKLPDHIISSTATRALSTAMIFARRFESKITGIELEPGIYEAHEEYLLEIIHNI